MSELILSWAGRDRVRETATQLPAVRELVSNFVAGEHLGDLCRVLHPLTDKGLLVAIRYLGEPVDTLEHAQANLQSYLDLISRLTIEGLAGGAEISVRLNSLGQELGAQAHGFPLEAARRIARAATNAGAMLTIESADASLADSTLQIWRQVHADLPRTGITLQANLHRTQRDIADLARPGTRIRLCKGGFRESRQVAFRSPHEIDLAYVRALRTLIGSQAEVLIATHDPRIVAIAEELLRRTGRSEDSYEFQMLYGVRPLEQRRLVDIGHRARCYVPFGPGWYDYYLHRLAENPANAALFTRALLGKR